MKGVTRENVVVAVFGAVFLLSLIMIFGSSFRATGHVTEIATSSNVTITTYFSIAMSPNLTTGIQFGSVDTLPSYNINATLNNESGFNTTTDQGAPPGVGTTYWMNVSTDSNTAVDFCIKGSELNTSGGDAIGLGNETYFNATATNTSSPFVISETEFTTSYVKSSGHIAAGSTNYYRFWLDVPAGTATGTYNNTVSFKGVAETTAC